MEDYVLTNIEVKLSEKKCNIDIDLLDKTLLKLPADKYIQLFVKIKNHLEFEEDK